MENMEENKKKKVLVSTIIGVILMVIIVVGATYAYFSVPINNNFTETKVSSKIEDIGTVSLLPEVNEITLNLSFNDMLQQENSLAYYGTNEGTTTTEDSEVIARASVSGAGIFNCTYNLTMDASGTKNMYDAVQSMENKNDNVILTINGVRYDFGTSDLFPKVIKGSIYGLTEDNSQDIVAQLKLINRNDVTQNELVGTDIEISFSMSDFSCGVIEMGSTGTYIMETDSTNISTDLVKGLYRYQGTNTEVTNNYICFGTSDKDTCLSNSGSYLFRIIGITPDGQIKIITKSPVTTTAWSSSSTDYKSYPDSLVLSHLNTLMSNVYTSEWIDIVLTKEWKYGEIGMEKFLEVAENETYEDYLNLENEITNTYYTQLGLLTLYDIAGQMKGEIDSTGGWLPHRVNSSLYEIEWLLTKVGYSSDDSKYYHLEYANDGSLSVGYSTTSKNVARPVAYLQSDLTLTGTGTEADPYLINLS